MSDFRSGVMSIRQFYSQLYIRSWVLLTIRSINYLFFLSMFCFCLAYSQPKVQFEYIKYRCHIYANSNNWMFHMQDGKPCSSSIVFLNSLAHREIVFSLFYTVSITELIFFQANFPLSIQLHILCLLSNWHGNDVTIVKFVHR